MNLSRWMLVQWTSKLCPFHILKYFWVQIHFKFSLNCTLYSNTLAIVITLGASKVFYPRQAYQILGPVPRAGEPGCPGADQWEGPPNLLPQLLCHGPVFIVFNALCLMNAWIYIYCKTYYGRSSSNIAPQKLFFSPKLLFHGLWKCRISAQMTLLKSQGSPLMTPGPRCIKLTINDNFAFNDYWRGNKTP